MASSLTRRESRALAEQALSYRLSGDCDALHVAPHATFMAGVDGPILLRRRRTRALASLRGDETSRPPRLRRSPPRADLSEQNPANGNLAPENGKGRLSFNHAGAAGTRF